jgi:hypothetical protein
VNRHQRRAAAHGGPTLDEWLSDIGRIHKDAAGLLDVRIVRPQNFAAIARAALFGNAEADVLARAVVKTVAHINSASVNDPIQCARCPEPLGGTTFTVVITKPSRDEADRALGFGLCLKCSDNAPLEATAVDVLRDIWPDARPVTIHPAEGHA